MPRGGPTPDHERSARDAPVAMPLIDGTAGDDAAGDAAASGRLPPLVVDVDGSLVNGDLLIEGVARMLAVAPLKLPALPVWLAGGRAAFKRRVARAAALPPETLALNRAVLDEIASAKEQGREVWLASAADETVVAPLAERVGASGFLASDGRTNLAGAAKARALVERFGEGGFDYVGNERRDLAVWRRARRIVGVGLPARLAREVRALDPEARLLPGASGAPRDVLRALRPHQWVKNLLVFVPLVAAHEIAVEPYLVMAGVFAVLCAVASGTYLVNDLLDLPHDRRHESKRHRPLASGRVAPAPMLGLAAVLIAGGIAAAFALSIAAGLCIVLYLAGSFAYSLWLKRLLYADVLALALLYVMRILAGAVPVAIVPSGWLLGFSLFIFLALAIVKRQTGLAADDSDRSPASGGRACHAGDLPAMTALGAASGIAAVVVLALYIQSPEVSPRYARPQILWLMAPLLLWWLGRMTLLAHRGSVDADPVVFAMRDGVSRLAGLGILVLFIAAS